MSTLHTQYANGQSAANANASAIEGHEAGSIGSSPTSRDAVAAAAAAAAAIGGSGGSGGVLQGAADYARGYSAMTPVGHGQALPPPQQQQYQQSMSAQAHHAHHSSQHHAAPHALPSMDMGSHAAAAAVAAGYQSSYGLGDGTGASMVGLMGSSGAWVQSPTSPLSPHSSAVAAAAAAAGQQHASQSSWYSTVYQPPHPYSPTSQSMVMYHDGYTASPSATAASYYHQPRARLTTTLWEDEQTLVYQVDCRGICVARRHDDNMINGTKLLNVVGMSRGKRDGILKNEKGRRVVKVGPMHLKGVWIPFDRARFLAEQFKVFDVLFPIFQPDPNSYLYGTIPISSPTTAAGMPAPDAYSAATAAAGSYDPNVVVAVNTPVTTTSSSTASHSHSASLSQAM
ncbi:hypothetical protein GGI07_002188, partial [Coemansia sp. Benny D115]